MDMQNKIIVMAGGSGALGQTVVPAFAGSGATVILIERNPSSKGQEASTMKGDVTDEADVRRLADEIVRTHGRIDVLINLVGAFAMGRLAETEKALWDRMLALNVTAAYLLSRAVLPSMLQRESGRILHVAAWAAVEPFPGAAAYLIAKSSLLALIKVLALELKGSGVTANAVLPTTIDTPTNRAAMPDADPSVWTAPASIAQALLFLASDQAAHINGAAVPIGPQGTAASAAGLRRLA
jgi:NAD(P)-dependent dehydrogenase (short-subunit alcohol dehydrogenase family)